MCYKAKHKISLNIFWKLFDEREFNHKMLIDQIFLWKLIYFTSFSYARQRPSENFLHPLGGSQGVSVPAPPNGLLRWAEHRPWSLQSCRHGLHKRAALLLKSWGAQVCLTGIDTIRKFIKNRNLDPHILY